MAVINDSGYVREGGMITIQFPHFKVDMSIDNETEMESAIEMLRKALEIHETEKAKMLLIRDVEREQKKTAEDAALKLFKDRMLLNPTIMSTKAPDPMWGSTGPDSMIGKY